MTKNILTERKDALKNRKKDFFMSKFIRRGCRVDKGKVPSIARKFACPPTFSRKICKRGFSLLETLIALSIFTIGFLALLKVEVLVIRQQNSALVRSLAIQQLTNIVDLMLYPKWHNHQAQWQQQWRQQIEKLLPNGTVQINNSHIKIQWQMPDTAGMRSNALEQHF